MVVVFVGALREDLFANIAGVIAILVRALREGGFADVTFVILILVRALREGGLAIVTFVVFVGVVVNGASAAATAGEIAGCQGKNGCNGKHCGEK
jgi:hypothetical protein